MVAMIFFSMACLSYSYHLSIICRWTEILLNIA